MSTNRDLEIRAIVTASVDEYLRAMREAGKSTDDFTSSAKRSARDLDDAASSWKRAGEVALGVFGGLSVSVFTAKMVDAQRQFDVLNSSLITVTGSSTAAAREFAWIKEFAATTPYALNEVTQAFVRMKSLGLDATEGTLRSYGNTASAMGKSLDQMIEAVADASTGEFERLKEFGIRASKEGDRVSLTFQGVTKTIGNSAAEIAAYLRDIGETQFGGAMAERAKTLDGALSNLGDTWDGLFLTISQQNVGGLIYDSVTLASAAIGDAIDILDAMNRATEENAKQTGAANAIQEGLAVTFETVAVLGANVAYVLEGIGHEIGGLAAQAAMAAQLDFSGAAAIGDMMKADAAAARAAVDAQTAAILNARTNAAEYRQVLESARAGTVDYSASVARLIEMQNAGTISAQQFRVAVESLQPAAKGAGTATGGLSGSLGGTKKAAKEANDAIEDLLLKLDAKEIEEATKAVDDYNRAWSDYLGDLDKTARGLDEQIEQYGLTEAQIAAVTLRRAEDRLEMARASEGVQPDYLAALEREVELRRQIAGSAGKLEVLDANARAAEEATREWERTAAAIEDSLIDALMDGGKSGAEYIEGLFRTMVLRPVLQAVVSPVANAITGILGFGAPGRTSTGGTSILGTANNAYSLYNGASNLYNTGAIGYQWATGTMSGANAAGTLYANATGTGMDGLFASTGWGTSGSAAGASGMMSSLASAGAYAAIAMAVVSLIGDIFGDDPDPRLRYKMSSDLGDTSGWEDGVAYAEGPFGYVGLDNATSKDVKGRDYVEGLKAMSAFDAMLASFMAPAEIEAVRSGMDGWMSSADRETRDYRRDPDLSQSERLVAISESAGGEQWEEVLEYIRGTQLGSDTAWVTDENGFVTQPNILPDGTTIADLFGKDALVTAFADVGAAGANALQDALRGVAAETAMLRSGYSDNEGVSQTWLDEQVNAMIGDMPQSLDDLSTALQGFGLTVEEIERIAIDAANAPFGTGRAGARTANAAQLDGEALAQYILRGFQADDVQTMLEDMGQTIGRDAARAWLDESTTTVIGEDGKEVTVDGYGTLMGGLATNYALMYQTPEDSWLQAQTALGSMFDDIGLAVPRSIEDFKLLSESFDLNTEAGRKLHSELWGLAPAFLDVAKAVEDTFAAISQTTATSVRDIEMSILDNAGKYDYLDKDLDRLNEELKSATTPAEVDRIVKETNSTAMAAWNLLNEDEQKRLAPEFITRLKETEDLAGTRLSVVPLDYGANPVVGLEQQELTRAQTEAATTQGQAAADLSVAAKTFSDLMVRLMPKQEGGAEGLISAGNALTAAANALSSAVRSTNSEVG